MKTIGGMLILVGFLMSCSSRELLSDFTGKQTTYSLQQASQYDISGTVILKEKRDGSSVFYIELSGTSGDAKYPVHLHLGDLTTQGASVAALLTPLDGQNGKSETPLTQLADERFISYAELIKMEACIKIHLSDTGPEKDIVLAAGNIGASVSKSNSGGRLGIATCQSN